MSILFSTLVAVITTTLRVLPLHGLIRSVPPIPPSPPSFPTPLPLLSRNRKIILTVWDPATGQQLPSGRGDEPSVCSARLDLQALQRVTEVQLVFRQAVRQGRGGGGVEGPARGRVSFASASGSARIAVGSEGRRGLRREASNPNASADEGRNERGTSSGGHSRTDNPLEGGEESVADGDGERGNAAEGRMENGEAEREREVFTWRTIQLGLRLRVGSQEGEGGTGWDAGGPMKVIDVRPRYTVTNDFDVPIVVCQDGFQVR